MKTYTYTEAQIENAISEIAPRNGCGDFDCYVRLFWAALPSPKKKESVVARTGDRVRYIKGVGIVAGERNRTIGGQTVGIAKSRWELWALWRGSDWASFVTIAKWSPEVEVNGEWYPVKDVLYLDTEVKPS